VAATDREPAAEPPATLALGTFSPSVLLRVARRTGRLADYGLEVTEHPVTSSPGQFEALLDGRYDAVLTSPDNVLAYRYVADNPLGRTVDVRIVCAIDRGLGLALYGRPDLEGAEPLRGATLGVDVPTSGFALAMYAVLDGMGLVQDDYRVVALGSTPMRLEALLKGACDATMLNAGNELKAEAAGCVALGRVSDLGRPYLGTVLAVVGETRTAAAKRLAAALLETSRDIAADGVDALVVEEAIDALSLSTALAGRYLLRLKAIDEGLVPDGRVDPTAVRTLVDLRRRYLPHNGAGPDPLDAALGPDSALLLDRARR
jgi:ABC-type nitrate/sulfonate/bicarbonate transport system substrate-binding protein